VIMGTSDIFKVSRIAFRRVPFMNFKNVTSILVYYIIPYYCIIAILHTKEHWLIQVNELVSNHKLFSYTSKETVHIICHIAPVKNIEKEFHHSID
jgi:hypothetical protein